MNDEDELDDETVNHRSRRWPDLSQPPNLKGQALEDWLAWRDQQMSWWLTEMRNERWSERNR